MARFIEDEFQEAIWQGNFALAERLLNDALDGVLSVKLAKSSATGGPHVVIWEVPSSLTAVLHLPEFISTPNTALARRLVAITPLLVHYYNSALSRCGLVALNLGDAGQSPGLAFSASTSDYFLIPDVDFVA